MDSHPAVVLCGISHLATAVRLRTVNPLDAGRAAVRLRTVNPLDAGRAAVRLRTVNPLDAGRAAVRQKFRCTLKNMNPLYGV